jgi:hypothetical protein
MREIPVGILDSPDERVVEIYMLTCKDTKKRYVGQAVSHILNHGRYRPYGRQGRFKCHISEAYSGKRKQCAFLNNAIRKYGKDSFDISLLDITNVASADERESHFILHYDTLYPNGYNLTSGGNTTRLALISRKKLSNTNRVGVESRCERFSKVLSDPTIRTHPCIHPLRRNNAQYGWYVYWNGCKTDFGGSHIQLKDSYEMATQLVDLLISRRDTLLRETP